MNYELDINGKRIALDVTLLKGDNVRVIMDEKPHDLAYQRISEACIQIRVNGCQVNAWVKPDHGGTVVVLNGRYFFVKDLNLQDQNSRAHAIGDTGMSQVLTPPMPAIVIQVPVALGDQVEKGDTVVVVSAMKMETAIKAPYKGVITRIGVAEGDKVMPGDILADIEPENDDKTKQEAP